MERTAERIVQEVDDLAAARTTDADGRLAALASGALDRGAVRAYLVQSYHLIEALPRLVATAYLAAASTPHRRVLVELLAELDQRPPSPAERWLQTCAAMGVFSDEVKASSPSSATQLCLDELFGLCRTSAASGVAAIYVYLVRRPAIASAERAAFTAHHGLRDVGPGMEYFDVAQFQAQGLANALRETLVRLAAGSNEAADEIRATAASIAACLDRFHAAPSEAVNA